MASLPLLVLSPRSYPAPYILQISLFELYELLYTAMEALGQSDKSLLELLQV